MRNEEGGASSVPRTTLTSTLAWALPRHELRDLDNEVWLLVPGSWFLVIGAFRLDWSLGLGAWGSFPLPGNLQSTI
jgi:hypothetical protein